MVVSSWDFPPVFVAIMKHHHLSNGSLEEIKDPLHATAVACTNMADHICKRLGIGYRIPETKIDLSELPSAKFLNVKADDMDSLLKVIGERYEKESSSFY